MNMAVEASRIYFPVCNPNDKKISFYQVVEFLVLVLKNKHICKIQHKYQKQYVFFFIKIDWIYH